MADVFDLGAALRELVQQQTALGQQQAALLQLQTETLRLQRLLIERALGLCSEEASTAPAAAVDVLEPETGTREHRPAPLAATPAPEPETGSPANGGVPSPAEKRRPQPEDSPLGDRPPRLHAVNSNGTPAPEALQPAAPSPSSRAARYLQPPQPRPARPVTRQDVERVTRLYEAGDAAHLVLQFGEYKGATLFQVAEIDPDYVRHLALTAQRPQVRAAARQLVVALEASQRLAQGNRSSTRRARADGR